MHAVEVLRALGETGALEAVEPFWSESMAALPPGPLADLGPVELGRRRQLAGMGAAVGGVVQRVAARIADDPPLRRLFWHCAWRLNEAPEALSFDHWPSLRGALGDDGGVFYLLAGLAWVPRVEAHHRHLGVPLTVTRATCAQVHSFSLNYAAGHDGCLGLPRLQLSWLRHYTRERYFRLGRLEFWLRPYPGGVHVYRHRATGQVVALAEAGARFDSQGYLPRPDAGGADEPLQEAEFAADDDAVRGRLITPWGRAEPGTVCLPPAQWERVLTQGDLCLQVHIPAGGGLSPEACRDSLQQAVAFFARHFPTEPARAIVCGSWIYNPDLERFLPGDAHLVAHLREVYLYPIPSGGSDGLWFIFLQDAFEMATAPRRTRLQRAVLDFLAAGNPWRCGGMFMLIDEVPAYGTQPYRRQWPVVGLAGA